MITIPMTVQASAVTIPMDVTASSASIPMSVGAVYEEAPTYNGDYEFTPSAEAQIVPIIGRRATENITINPIPSNYGLITWDGSAITVS